MINKFLKMSNRQNLPLFDTTFYFFNNFSQVEFARNQSSSTTKRKQDFRIGFFLLKCLWTKVQKKASVYPKQKPFQVKILILTN